MTKKALNYCEKYGILPYKEDGKTLVYYANYPAYGMEKRYTIKVTVNLETMEETRKRLKKWNRKGNENLYK